MKVSWIAIAVACLLALSIAEAKSVDFIQMGDQEVVFDDGVIMPKDMDGNNTFPQPKVFDGGVIQPKHLSQPYWLSQRITNLRLPLTPGIPARFSHRCNTTYSGTSWNITAPINTTISLNCTLNLVSSWGCSLGMCQISTGSSSQGFCGTRTVRCLSNSPITVTGFKLWGGFGGFFQCVALALGSTTTAASTTTTTPTTTSTTTPTTTSTTTPTTTSTTTPTTTSTTTTTPTTTSTTTPTTTSTTTTTPTTTSTSTTASVTTPNSPTCRCGRKNPIVRIVGGVQTTINEYPWQVGLVPVGSTRPFCGGSIISNQYILTAAHCVTGATASSFKVVVGEHNWALTTETTATSTLSASQITIHPSYNSVTQDNDIAIIKLSAPIVFPTTNKVAPVCLPPAGNQYDNVQATVTGWGTLIEGGTQPQTLMEVTIPTMSNTACQQLLGTSAITANMLCAGPVAGGKDSCQGDSGGPLTTSGTSSTTNKYEVQIGVVSWGYGCARPNQPGVYTRVTNYLTWINSIIAGSLTCPPPP